MKKKLYSRFVFLYVLIALICFYPYEFYSFYFRFLPDKIYVSSIVILIITLFVATLLNSFAKPSKLLITIMIIQFLGYWLPDLMHGTVYGAYGKLITMFLAIVLISFIDGSVGLEDFFRHYNKWILLMAMLGTITFFLVLTTGLQPFMIVEDRAGGGNGKELYNYYLTFSKANQNLVGMIRYSGFFDEPGAMGYWGIYALIINRLFVKNNRLETILIICLIFTFSLGYYVQAALYLILFNVKRKNIGQSVLVFILVGVVFGGVFHTQGTRYDAVFEKSFGRLESIQEESGGTISIAIDNRAENTENALREFLENPLLGTSNRDVAVGNNIYESLALYGIIGSVLILFPFFLLLFWAIKYRDYELLKAFIVIVAGFTHRPFHASLLYFFMIYCIIMMCRKKRLCVNELAYKK